MWETNPIISNHGHNKSQVTGVNINQKIATEIPEAILDLAWKSDGTGMFCACGDNQARLWDLNANRLTTVAQHQGPVGEVAWCGELPGLFTLSFDGTMAIWDLRQQQPITSLNFMQQANIKVITHTRTHTHTHIYIYIYKHLYIFI